MNRFVRKNLLTISGTFENASGTQPTSVTAVLHYRDLSDAPATTTINLSLGTDGVTWSGAWDSSAAKEGRVEWMVYSSGGVVAAAEGAFSIEANCANTV
jgi:hypothetical protein